MTTDDGLGLVFAVNVLAPYLLTALMERPARLIYWSTGSSPVTQAWLAVSDDPAATGTGGYFFHQHPQQVHPAARDVTAHDELRAYCARLSGTELPA